MSPSGREVRSFAKEIAHPIRRCRMARKKRPRRSGASRWEELPSPGRGDGFNWCLAPHARFDHCKNVIWGGCKKKGAAEAAPFTSSLPLCYPLARQSTYIVAPILVKQYTSVGIAAPSSAPATINGMPSACAANATIGKSGDAGN